MKKQILWMNLFMCLIAFTSCGAGLPTLNSANSDTTQSNAISANSAVDPAKYSIGGVVSGLSGTLVLQDNEGELLSVSADGSFSFVTKTEPGKNYAVSILTQPAGQFCRISNGGSGTVTHPAGTQISVVCLQPSLAARSGSNFQCYLNKLGKSYCWGGNSNGQLGNGTTTNSSVPVAVTTSGAINGRAILAMSGGGVHACAIADDENAYCWGSNSAGQLGNNSTTSSSVAVAVTAGGVFNGLKIKAITSGSNFNCAIASDDNAYCWGYNGSGQLGIGTTTQSNVPTAVLGLPAGPVKKISAGSSHICAVASDDRIYCWGENSDGQLGNGTTTNSSSPVAVSTSGVLSGKKFLSISSGELHTCIVADDNKPYCWGRNGSGQLGNGTYTPSTTPVAVYMSGVLNGKTIKALASGFLTNCVIASDHLPYCWGNQGTTGGLGNNLAMSSTNVPVTVLTSGVLNGKTVKALSSGNSQHCVVANDDLPYCWGMNYEGQVGDGTTTNATVPVAVTALP